MALNKLNSLFNKIADDSVSGLTFKLADVQFGKPAKRTGNIGARVTCSNGRKIIFWKDSADQVITESEDGVSAQVLPGVKLLDDPDENGYYGLIPKDAISGGYEW